MKFIAAAPALSQWTLIALPTLVMALATLFLVWAGGTPASAKADTEKPTKPSTASPCWSRPAPGSGPAEEQRCVLDTLRPSGNQ